MYIWLFFFSFRLPPLTCSHCMNDLHMFTFHLLRLSTSRRSGSDCYLFASAILTSVISPEDSLECASAEIADPAASSQAQMGHGHFLFSSHITGSIPRHPAHLLCSTRHLLTNLFVSTYWKADLSFFHALVALWCLQTWPVISCSPALTWDSPRIARK